MHKLIILPPAARFLKKLKEKPLKAAFQKAVDEILLDPYVGELKTGDLLGVYGYDVFYNKTNYELAYTIVEENDKTVVVILAGTRENFYEELKLKVELPFKCNPEEFERIYQEEYKSKISHGFIRNKLGLSESVRLKLNGTFKRWLYLLDQDNRLYRVQYRIQTALWTDPETGKDNYVSIFPNFIKRYCPLCLHMLEYLSCQVGKGEDILRHFSKFQIY